jgi:hypothetical protein
MTTLAVSRSAAGRLCGLARLVLASFPATGAPAIPPASRAAPATEEVPRPCP